MIGPKQIGSAHVSPFMRTMAVSGAAIATVLLLQVGNAGAAAQPAARLQATTAVTMAATAAPTLDPVGFDFSKTTVFKSDGDAIELTVPASWKTNQIPGISASKNLLLTFGGTPDNPFYSSPILIQVTIGSAADIYKLGINAPKLATAPDEALKSLITFLATPQPGGLIYSPGDVHSAKVGSYDGFELLVTAKAVSGSVSGNILVRLAALPNGMAVQIAAQVATNAWAQTQPILDKIFDSVVIEPENIIADTPTPGAIATAAATP